MDTIANDGYRDEISRATLFAKTYYIYRTIKPLILKYQPVIPENVKLNIQSDCIKLDRSINQSGKGQNA